MIDKAPLTGGIVAGVLSLLILWIVGRLGPAEANLLLESALPTIRFLCATVGGAAATILALMLTVLSLSYAPEERFRIAHYDRIRSISLYSTISLTLAVFVLLMLVVPLEASDRVPSVAYTALYYVILVVSAALGGLMVAIMLMLYEAITGLVDFFKPTGDSWIVDRRRRASDDDASPEEEPT